MIDHLGLSVPDLEASKAFYLAALKPLGITLLREVSAEENPSGDAIGMGRDGKPFFWIGEGKAGEGTHLAFAAASRAEVDAFYEAALAAGATDNGAPGVRPIYHPNYYGAFVIDPNGINLEAVHHGPGSS